MPDSDSTNIFTAISNSYYNLTASEKKLAEYVHAHKTDVQFMSISELAEACGLADATVSRFCRRMKLRGYSDFKLSLAKAAAEEKSGSPDKKSGQAQPTEGDLSQLCDKVLASHILAIKQSKERLKPDNITAAVDLICSADRVWCMGQGGSMILAEETAHLFSTVCSKFFSISDSHTQLTRTALFGPGDVLFFLSYSGSTKEMMDVMTQARAHGASIVLITRFLKSPGAMLANVTLQCGSDEGPLQMGSIPARVAQLYIVDVLFQEFCRRDPESTQRCSELVADALTEKHM